MKSFHEVKKEIQEAANKSSRNIKSFSKADYGKLTVAALNTPDYKVDVAKYKNGKCEIEEVYPSKIFRETVVKDILKESGHDEQEAKALSEKYMFKQSQGQAFYDLSSATIYDYIDCGKKFDFHAKPDFIGGILIEAVAESETEYKAPRTGETGRIKKTAHKKLKQKSKAPVWCKTKL